MSIKSTFVKYARSANKLSHYYKAANDKYWTGYYRGKAAAYETVIYTMNHLHIKNFEPIPDEYYQELAKSTT